MSLEDLGNIGELIAAIGVIISLIYLAVQIRQNTLSNRAVTYQAISAHISDANRVIVENPDVARLVLSSEKDFSALSEEDRRRYVAHMSSIFRHFDNLYYQYRTGTLEESQWESLARVIRHRLQRPGIVSVWQELSPIFTDEFAAYIESIRRRVQEGESAGEGS